MPKSSSGSSAVTVAVFSVALIVLLKMAREIVMDMSRMRKRLSEVSAKHLELEKCVLTMKFKQDISRGPIHTLEGTSAVTAETPLLSEHQQQQASHTVQTNSVSATPGVVPPREHQQSGRLQTKDHHVSPDTTIHIQNDSSTDGSVTDGSTVSDTEKQQSEKQKFKDHARRSEAAKKGAVTRRTRAAAKRAKAMQLQETTQAPKNDMDY